MPHGRCTASRGSLWAACVLWNPGPLQQSRKSTVGLPRAGHAAHVLGGGRPPVPRVCPALLTWVGRGQPRWASPGVDQSSLWMRPPVHDAPGPGNQPAAQQTQAARQRLQEPAACSVRSSQVQGVLGPQSQESLSFQPEPTRTPLSAKAAEAGLTRSQCRPRAATHCPGYWPQASVSLQTQQTKMQRNWPNWCRCPKLGACALVHSVRAVQGSMAHSRGAG